MGATTEWWKGQLKLNKLLFYFIFWGSHIGIFALGWLV
jgi:NADPH oxidase